MKIAHVERERHPRPPGAGAGVGRARAARHPLPAGNQGRRPTRLPVCALRHGGLLVLLARHEGLFRRRPARQQGTVAPSGRPSRTPSFDYESRIVTADVDGIDDRVRLRAEWRQGLSGQDALPRIAARLRPRALHAAGKRVVHLRRHQHRAHRHRRASQRAQAARDRTASRGARAAGAIIARGLVDTGRALDPATTRCSRGGRRGGTCVNATSAGGSTTCWPASRLRSRDVVHVLSASSARATMPRWSPALTS